jgi:enoyl-[acyl-carrier protein] reductase/trans-2-enoyl-CoA reductase (NAD+)
MFRERLYKADGSAAEVDDNNRLRLDDWELREDIQAHCKALWPQLTDENLAELTDYKLYKDEFLKLFGFGVDDVDYDADVDPVVPFDVIDI